MEPSETSLHVQQHVGSRPFFLTRFTWSSAPTPSLSSKSSRHLFHLASPSVSRLLPRFGHQHVSRQRGHTAFTRDKPQSPSTALYSASVCNLTQDVRRGRILFEGRGPDHGRFSSRARAMNRYGWRGGVLPAAFQHCRTFDDIGDCTHGTRNRKIILWCATRVCKIDNP